MKLIPLLFAFLILTGPTLGQAQKHDPCDTQFTFCWYGPYDDGSDEVKAWGQNWTPQDASEKQLKVPTAIRCVKRLHVCLKSVTHDIEGRAITRIDILPVQHWSSQQVTANGEDQTDPCERESYIINRLDRTVLLIDSPGPRADSPGCSGLLGKPRTVVYKLQQ